MNLQSLLAGNVLLLPSSSTAESEVMKTQNVSATLESKEGGNFWLYLRVEQSPQITDPQAKPVLHPVPTVSADVP